MPQSVRIEGGAAEATINSRQMKNGLAYIVVSDTSGNNWPTGNVLIRAGSNVSCPQTQAYAATSDATVVRELRAGEKVTFEGT